MEKYVIDTDFPTWEVKIVVRPNWRISRGTLDVGELTRSFMTALKDIIGSHQYEQFLQKHASTVALIMNRSNGYIYPKNHGAWGMAEVKKFLFHTLTREMASHAPANCYFGARPNDISDFGYWLKDPTQLEPGDKYYIPSEQIVDIWNSLCETTGLAVIAEMLRLEAEVRYDDEKVAEISAMIDPLRKKLKEING